MRAAASAARAAFTRSPRLPLMKSMTAALSERPQLTASREQPEQPGADGS